MDITAILDWIKVMAEKFGYSINEFWTPHVINTLPTGLIQGILVFIMLAVWVGIVYYLVLPLLALGTKGLYYTSSKAGEDSIRTNLLEILPRKTQLLYAFVFFSIFYFIVVFSVISYFTSTIGSAKHYVITNSMLIIDNDEDDNVKKELLMKTGIDPNDSAGVLNDEITTPDATYDIYIKQNYPSISIPKKGKLAVCTISVDGGLSCSDKYSYNIKPNLASNDKKGEMDFEFGDDKVLLTTDDGNLTPNEVKQLLLVLQNKGMLTLYKDNPNWMVSFISNNKEKISNLYSPSFVHILYSNSRVNKVGSAGYNKIDLLLSWLGYHDNDINKYYIPWILEGKMNYPEDVTKQIRTYDVSGLRALYINILPADAGFGNFIADLKSKNFDVSKILEPLFGDKWSTFFPTLSEVNMQVHDNGPDTVHGILGYITRFISWLFTGISYLYQLGIILIIFLIIYKLVAGYLLTFKDMLQIAKMNEFLNKAHAKIEKIKTKFGYQSEIGSSNNSNVISSKDVLYNKLSGINDNFIVKGTMVIVINYILANIFVRASADMFNVKYVDFATSWTTFMWFEVLLFIISIFIAKGILDLFDKFIIYIISSIKNNTVGEQ